jgi:hypothetical protein
MLFNVFSILGTSPYMPILVALYLDPDLLMSQTSESATLVFTALTNLCTIVKNLPSSSVEQVTGAENLPSPAAVYASTYKHNYFLSKEHFLFMKGKRW